MTKLKITPNRVFSRKKNLMVGKEKAVFSVQTDNARTKVTRWTFAPASETGPHCHPHDFIVIPLTKGKLLLQTKEGESVRTLEPGQSYFRNAGIEHNAVNVGGNEIVLMEIEIKS